MSTTAVTPVLTGLHLGILATGLLGFASLALATERHGEHLLRRVPAPRWRLFARVAGWLLLATALGLGVAGLGAGVGITLWLGWLSIAALALVFALPKWPWQPPVRAKPQRKPRADAGAEAPPPPPATACRLAAAALLLATAAVFAIALWRVEPNPMLREDAIRGGIGPWTFTLAETDRDTPELVDMDVPLKAYRLRFCEACDRDIRQAYLKVNRPRSTRAVGMAFEGNRWDRNVEIQLPSTVKAESELWLTVVGKDGAVHQASWPMARVSPATVAWFAQQQGDRHAGTP